MFVLNRSAAEDQTIFLMDVNNLNALHYAADDFSNICEVSGCSITLLDILRH
jgi:hypothetical protein